VVNSGGNGELFSHRSSAPC